MTSLKMDQPKPLAVTLATLSSLLASATVAYCSFTSETPLPYVNLPKAGEELDPELDEGREPLKRGVASMTLEKVEAATEQVESPILPPFARINSLINQKNLPN